MSEQKRKTRLKTYDVLVKVIGNKTIRVRAEDDEEAIQLALGKVGNGRTVLPEEGFIDAIFVSVL